MRTDAPGLDPDRPRPVLGLALLAVVVVALALTGLKLRAFTENFGSTERRISFAVALPGAFDDFNHRARANILGTADSGEPWAPLSGIWSRAQGTAQVKTPARDLPSLATLPVGTADGSVAVTAAHVVDGMGLAFRCLAPKYCWMLEAAPKAGTWNVIRVFKGKVRSFGNVGLVSVADGTRLQVNLTGDRIDVVVGGSLRRTIRNSVLQGEPRAGLVLAAGGSSSARWDDFRVGAPPARALLDAQTAVVHDDFGRPDAGSLGRTPTGQQWQPLGGTWQIRDRYASLPEPAPTGPSLDLLDMGSGDGVIQVTGDWQQGAGMSFRCQDAQNCWMLEAVPGYATWSVIKIAAGRTTHVADVGLALDSTVNIRLQGDKITLYVNGKRLLTVHDGFLRDAHLAGLSYIGLPNGSANVRWSSFAVGPRPDHEPVK